MQTCTAWKLEAISQWKASPSSPPLAFRVLTNGTFCIDADETKLVIRPEYDRVWQDALLRVKVVGKKPPALVLIGNPGIGKSWCLNYLACRALEEGHGMVFIHANGWRVGYGTTHCAGSWADHKTIPESVAQGLLTAGKRIFVFHDLKSTNHFSYTSLRLVNLKGNATFLFATSPDERNYKDIPKEYTSRFFYMSPLSKGDAQAYWDFCVGIAWSAEEAARFTRAFNVVGGVSRALQDLRFNSATTFDDDLRIYESQIESAVLTMNPSETLLLPPASATSAVVCYFADPQKSYLHYMGFVSETAAGIWANHIFVNHYVNNNMQRVYRLLVNKVPNDTLVASSKSVLGTPFARALLLGR